MRRILGLAAGLLCALAAHAQTFPAKAITLICPWPAGGGTDLHLRKLGEIASRHLGQPVVIENRPGGSGMNGPATMAKTARPDGYTISQLAITAYPRAAHAEGGLGSARRLQLHHRRRGLHLRHRGEGRFAVQDLPGSPHLRESEPGQALVRHARHRHLAAPGDGGDRRQGERAVPAHSVQGLRRRRDRADGRARDGAGRLHRLGEAGGLGRAAPARDARRQAHALERAHGQRARHRYGVELAVRPGRAPRACRRKW